MKLDHALILASLATGFLALYLLTKSGKPVQPTASRQAVKTWQNGLGSLDVEISSSLFDSQKGLPGFKV